MKTPNTFFAGRQGGKKRIAAALALALCANPAKAKADGIDLLGFLRPTTRVAVAEEKAPRVNRHGRAGHGHSKAGPQIGLASFYGGRHKTASGGHVGAATCAHRWLPMGTRVKVTNLVNGRSEILTVNDRGPFVRGRIVDVSIGAAERLAMRGAGVARVRLEVVASR